MKQFENRVAIITGAAQGIGAATAKRFAQAGASVALLDFNLEKAQAAAEEIMAEGGKAVAFACDVMDRNQVEGSIAAVAAEFGRIDVLVNNAGVTRDNLLFRMSDEDWDMVIDTHLKGSFLCSRAAQSYMVKQKYGKIVMVSSRSALGNRGQTNYSAAKAGMQGMVRTMAIELGPFGINVNAVAPGFIETDMTRGIAEKTGLSYEEVKENAIKANAIKRVGKPVDIANTIAFLSSDEAEYITGQIIYVAGKPTI